MSVIKKNIYDLTKKDLEDFIISNKIKSFRTNQIWNWLYVKGSQSFFEMNNLSREIMELLDSKFSISLLNKLPLWI